MAERLEHVHRLLKPTGSMYLHCDPTASHYLKILLDVIFGPQNFRNEITWKRRYGNFSTVHQSKKFGACTDSILLYSKSETHVFNPQYSFNDPTYQDYIEKTFKYTDDRGRRYGTDNLANPAPRPNLMYDYKGYKPPKNGWAISHEKMKLWDKEGRIHFPKSKSQRIRRKRFLDELKGKPVQSLWEDIDVLSSHSKERLGYPTQKPCALMERIISASSNEGDLVLDPFCGCGTTIEAARKLNRQWVGIDISAFAIDLVRNRRLKDPKIPTFGIPADLEGAKKLAAEQPFAFESWVITRLPGFAPNVKQRGDGGIDGRATLADEPDDVDSRLALAQVKGGKFNVSALRDFQHVIEREGAALGCYLTLNPAPPRRRADAKAAGRIHVAGHSYDKLVLWSIADYFEGKHPVLPAMTDPYSGRPLNQMDFFVRVR